MIVQLERVVLAAAAGGLSLRIDRSRPSVDWTRGGVDPGLGAYALAPTTGQTVSLQAQFSFPDTSLVAGPSVTVRAKTADPDTMPFGGVGPTVVPVPGAGVNVVTPLMSLPLNQVRLLERGVGRYAMTLRWQFQETAGAPWVDLDDFSSHVVYVTLDTPGAPWSQATTAAGQLRQPWALVLDHSCCWAKGITIADGDLSGAIDKAARRIEAGLYALGQRDEVPLQYQDAGVGAYATEYSDQVAFLCTKFLRLLAGETAPEIETAVDCSDCAAALVVFANVLGCDLTSKRLTSVDGFRTNQVVSIGRAPDNSRGYPFGYHEIAGRGPSPISFRVFDACLMIDRDADPAGKKQTPHEFELAQGLTLTSDADPPVQLRYVHRLVEKNSWLGLQYQDVPVRCLDECDGAPAPLDTVTIALHDEYVTMINGLVGESADEVFAAIDLVPIPLPGFMAYHRDLETPHFAALKRFVKQSVDFYYVASPGRVRQAPTHQARTMADRRVRVCLGSADTPSQAQDALAWVLAQSAVRLSLLTEHGKPVVGDVGFAGPRAGSVFFVRGNTLAWLSNTGREPASLLPLATTVDVVVNREARRHQ